jgi:hypothetical protein
MKTFEEHFIESMPADIAAMAIRNTAEDILNLKICKTPATALQRAFWWSDTDQGSAFWANVFLTISREGDFRNTRIEQLEQDEKRLNWLLSTQSGYSINGLGTREQIDKAIDDEWFERERHDKIMSGMEKED